jgi:outer membrane protein assembly factor BamB
VIRPALVFVALAGPAAGCAGGGSHDTQPPPPPPPKPQPKPQPKPSAPQPKPVGRVVYVSVIDGDTHQKIRTATVAIAGRKDRVSTRAIGKLHVKRARPLPVTAWAPGYPSRTVRLGFNKRVWRTLYLYQPALQWPMYGVVPARTQVQEGIKLRPPFRIAWSRGMGSLIEFPAVVSDGVAFIGNAHGVIRAVSMKTGRIAWRRDTGDRMAASPAILGDTIVAHTMSTGHVFVLNRYNGAILKRYTIGSPIESSPVVHNGIDYFGDWNGTIYALDLKTGHAKWTYSSGYKITSSAALYGGKVFIGDYGGRLLALNGATGSLRWSGSVNGRIYGTPAVAEGRVFVPSSSGGSITAFSVNGSRLWSRSTGSYVYSSPAAWDGRVFVGSYDGLLYGLSASSGSTLWTANAGGRISGAAVVVAGIVYAGTTRRIIGVDARTGRVRLTFAHGDYVPVSGNGQRLLFHGSSRLYALEPKRHRS